MIVHWIGKLITNIYFKDDSTFSRTVCGNAYWITYIWLCKKADLKGVAGVDISKASSSRFDLASFKAQVDKLDIDKLKNVLAALSMLNNVVDNDVAKKNVYDKLVNQVDLIDTKLPITSGLKTKR